MSPRRLTMYCWKNWFAISGDDAAKLLTKSNATAYQLYPVTS
jgi:hypothetical protein